MSNVLFDLCPLIWGLSVAGRACERRQSKRLPHPSLSSFPKFPRFPSLASLASVSSGARNFGEPSNARISGHSNSQSNSVSHSNIRSQFGRTILLALFVCVCVCVSILGLYEFFNEEADLAKPKPLECAKPRLGAKSNRKRVEQVFVPTTMMISCNHCNMDCNRAWNRDSKLQSKPIFEIEIELELENGRAIGIQIQIRMRIPIRIRMAKVSLCRPI